MEDIRQTKEWARYLRSCGWVIELIGSTSTVPPRGFAAGATQPPRRNLNVFIKRIPLTPFSMMKIQRFRGKLDFSDLKRVKMRHKVIYTVLEPASATPGVRRRRNTTPGETFAPARVRPSRPFLPTKTVIIDLKKSEKQLWNDLSTNAKRILRKERLNLPSCHSERTPPSGGGSRGIPFNCKATRQRDLSTRRLGRDDSIGRLGRDDKEERIGFYKAWKGSSKTWLMGEERFNKLLDAFGNKASLWVSENDGKFLSGILLLKSKDTANYFQTWTSEKGRKLGAHYHLVWRVLLECKSKGLRWFDFEGVLDERWPQKKWAGFSEFKKKFGGEIVTYPGSFTKWF